MTEKNRNSLIQAIEGLPEYDPAPVVWKQICQQLADSPLTAAIQELPEMDPPDFIWDRIQQDLTPAKEVRIQPWKRWSAAAGFAMLLSMAWILGKNVSSDHNLKATISYRVEQVDDLLLQNDWMEDDSDFLVLDEICSQHPFMCNRQDVQSLRMELAELTDAKMQLVDVLGPYGTDLYLIEQLNEIEMERTKLLKQILTQVI
ncbi:MAG: hypothetical protein KDC34_07035 [Saprospiraceae bacterium]|nr:hypothetical protein [Saprospiraceae bacterium]